MNEKGRKRRAPDAGGVLGHGGSGHLSLAPPCHGAEWSASNDPTVVIVPRRGIHCQIRTISKTAALLALHDDVLERYNQAKAAYIAGGDPADFRAAVALADDRRALLAQIGGETWP